MSKLVQQLSKQIGNHLPNFKQVSLWGSSNSGSFLRTGTMRKADSMSVLAPFYYISILNFPHGVTLTCLYNLVLYRMFAMASFQMTPCNGQSLHVLWDLVLHLERRLVNNHKACKMHQWGEIRYCNIKLLTNLIFLEINEK